MLDSVEDEDFFERNFFRTLPSPKKIPASPAWPGCYEFDTNRDTCVPVSSTVYFIRFIVQGAWLDHRYKLTFVVYIDGLDNTQTYAVTLICNRTIGWCCLDAVAAHLMYILEQESFIALEYRMYTSIWT